MPDHNAKPLRIGYFADGPWGHRALARIVENGRFEIAFITPRFVESDPVLRDWADRLGVPCMTAPDINAPEFIAKVAALEPQLLVSMSFDQILRRDILNLPPLGFINCHASALPFYRGRNPLNWALINGETRIGVTVHYVDEGIDTGDIIVQVFSAVSERDTYADLLARTHDLCATALLDALVAIHQGTAVRQKQDLSGGWTYFSRRRAGDEWLNWAWPSARIHNFIRAITVPGPCARTLHGDQIVAIVESELIDEVPPHLGTDGEVIGRNAAGVVVKTGDTALRITRVATVRDDETLDNLVVPRFPLGTRLGVNLYHEVITLRRKLADLERRIKG